MVNLEREPLRGEVEVTIRGLAGLRQVCKEAVD
jgi:hypothetical protein